LFGSLYESFFPVLMRIAYRITCDMDSAEDLCQEAFIRYYEKGPLVPDPDQAKYWLIRVVKNLSLNYEKWRGRERRAYGKIGRQVPPKGETGESEVLKKETQEKVQEALARLPKKLKVVLILKEYGDLNYREIAKVLGITEGNVKVRVFRAREQLAQVLESGDVYVP